LHSTISISLEKFKEKISNLFTPDSIFLRYMSLASGLIQRMRVLKPDKLLSMLAIASFRSKPSTLTDMASIYKSINDGVTLTTQSLQARINSNQSVDFVKMALQSFLKAKILKDFPFAECELLKTFKRVLIEDSSSFELSEYLKEDFKGYGGNSSLSSIKMNSIYDIKAGKFVHLEESPAVTSDQTLGTRTIHLIEKGDILLRDLGYLKVKNLIEINQIGAFFLSRLSGSLSIYETENGKAIPFSQLFEKYNRKGLLDIYVYIGREKFRTRLVAYRVSEEAANKRRRDLNKNAKCKGRKVASETSLRQNYSIFITNVPEEIWPVEVVQTIYRLRWQIELIFRSWKSQLKIHIISGATPNRIRLLLYAKWLSIIICAIAHELVIWVAENVLNREASFHKTINFFLLQDRFEQLLKKPKKIIGQLLDELGNGWLRDKKKISTMEMVRRKKASYV
jgi:hypothetical protein